jgi:hypothetical protein
MNTTNGALIAASVAAMLAAIAGCSSNDSSNNTPTQAASQRVEVKCEGINTCKGTSECASSDGTSGCQGLNDCKGQGWITVPKEECDAKGGKVLADNASAGADAAPQTPAPEGGAKTAAIKCEGINECKGTSDCAARDGSSSCKGHNECKGKGWVSVPSEADCTGKGGTVIS